MRLNLEHAVAVLTTNNFHNTTEVHGLLSLKYVDCDRCVAEAQEGSDRQPGLPGRILTLPSRSRLVDKPGARTSRLQHVVRAYCLDNEIVGRLTPFMLSLQAGM